jgi:predicted O-linked N-acetylglucosamine transferase (SPINDLY family)
MPINNIDSIIALFSSDMFEDALDAIEELIEEHPKDAVLFNIRGACYAGLQQMNLAVENYEKAIELNPEYAKPYYNLAGVLHEINEFDASIQSYQSALFIEPDYAEAHNNLGNVLKEIGKLDEAIVSYEKAVALKPDYIEAYYSLGDSFYEVGKLEDTIKCYSRVLEYRPKLIGIHNNLGNIFRELGRFDESVLSYEKAISIDSGFVEGYYNLGVTFQELKQLDNALVNYKKAIELKPNYPEAFNNLGTLYKELKNFDSSIHSYQKAIDIQPDYAEAFNNLGVLYKEIGQLEKAVQSHENAIKINSKYDEAYNNLGILFMELGQLENAIESYKSAIKANNNFVEAINNLGLLLMNLGQIDEAIKYYQKALKINPSFALTYNNLGLAYKNLHIHDAASECFQKGIALDPNYSDAFCNFGHLLTEMDNLQDALANYEHAFAIKPDADYLLGTIIHTKMHLCIWSDYLNNLNELQAQINDGQKRIDAFSFMALIDDPELQGKVSKIYFKDRNPRSNLLPQIKNHPKHKKIRIGYFSADFREHPVSYLTAELYETHDRSQFDVHAFSYGPNTEDEMNLRIKAGVDHFHDVREMSHKEIVTLSRSLEIDIAVDLSGATHSSKTEVFAMLAAPIQTSYIGWLGTMGADYYDYLIAAEGMIPKKNQKYFSEKIVYLPIYQVNDSKESLPKATFSRKDLGLPEDIFVFCCFNNTFKITPIVFDSWARILKGVEKSVMMIYVSNKIAQKNLIKEIKLRNIDPKRLIFGERLSRPEYLDRYRLADLFLDTFPYNAGTTASDALRMGLPLLTINGNSFNSREAANIVHAVNLPEMITSSQEEYESLAIELANNPKEYRIIKEKLADNLLSAPLFNTPLFTKNLESAFKIMFERYHNQLKADHIYSEEING